MTTLIPKFDFKNGGSTPTGAINRAINLKLAETASVKDFGAVGDGTTDDTTAINNALASGVASIFFPVGNYAISSQLVVASNTTIFGAEGAQVTQTANNTRMFYVNGCSYVTIDSLILNGKGINDTAPVTNNSGGVAFGIHITNSNYVRVKNCSVLKFKNIGIVEDSSNNIWIEDNMVQGTGPDPALPNGDTTVSQFGICLGQLGTTGVNSVDYSNVIVSGNNVSYTHDPLFSGPGLGNVKILNNSLSNASNHGGYFYPGNDWLIDGNYFTSFYSQGFKFQFYANVNGADEYIPKNITCSNNIVEGVRTGQWGIAAGIIDELDGAGNTAKSRRQYQNMNILNNTIIPAGGRGITIQQAFNSTISGNTIQRNEYGVYVINFTGSIDGNTIYGCDYTPITAFAPYIDSTIISNNKIIGGAGYANVGTQSYITAEAFLGFASWQASSQYIVGDVVKNGANVYVCITGGISAASGGPTGTGTNITDGTVVWNFYNTVAYFSGGYISIRDNEVTQNQNDKASYSLIAENSTLIVEVLNNTFPPFKTDGTTTLNWSVVATVRHMNENICGGFASGQSATTYSIYTQGIPGRNFFGTAAPSSGTWVANDKVWNTSPTAGGTLLWINVSSGTPGTWKTVAIGA